MNSIIPVLPIMRKASSFRERLHALLVMERAIRGLAGATTYAEQNLVVDLEPSLWREDQRRVVGEFVPLRASILAHAYRRT